MHDVQWTWLHGDSCCSSGIHTHTHKRGGGIEKPVPPRSPRHTHGLLFLVSSLMALTSRQTHTHTWFVATHTPHPQSNTKSGLSCIRIKPFQLNRFLNAQPSYFFESDSLMTTGHTLAQGAKRPRHIAPRLSANHKSRLQRRFAFTWEIPAQGRLQGNLCFPLKSNPSVCVFFLSLPLNCSRAFSCLHVSDGLFLRKFFCVFTKKRVNEESGFGTRAVLYIALKFIWGYNSGFGSSANSQTASCSVRPHPSQGSETNGKWSNANQNKLFMVLFRAQPQSTLMHHRWDHF